MQSWDTEAFADDQDPGLWYQWDLTGSYFILQQVNGGSKAEQADLQPGDIILEINGENTADMLNVEAQNKIKNSKTHLELVVERSVNMHVLLHLFNGFLMIHI